MITPKRIIQEQDDMLEFGERGSLLCPEPFKVFLGFEEMMRLIDKYPCRKSRIITEPQKPYSLR